MPNFPTHAFEFAISLQSGLSKLRVLLGTMANLVPEFPLTGTVTGSASHLTTPPGNEACHGYLPGQSKCQWGPKPDCDEDFKSGASAGFWLGEIWLLPTSKPDSPDCKPAPGL
jgi:hypothetical protein